MYGDNGNFGNSFGNAARPGNIGAGGYAGQYNY